MNTIAGTKELAVTDSPILVFDCTLPDGTQEHWSTQPITIGSTTYSARVGKHNLFEFQTASGQSVDTVPKITIELANADSHFSEIERNTGFKGSTLTATFVFYDLKAQLVTTESAVLFQGIANSPELITEATFRISAMNRISSQRVFLPPVQVQRRCVWDFPATSAQRAEAVSGGASGAFSRFYACGYSPDQTAGCGNLNGATPFTSCSFTRADCEARGMFNKDSSNRPTARFSGIEFVPSTITVRTTGESGSHLSPVSINTARYNDFVPLIYGTAWFAPDIVFARNDGNLTRMEVLLGMGPVSNVYTVLVNNIAVPQGHAGQNMTGTGWYNVVSYGGRNGGFNLDFTDAHGNPLGDPYGGMAFLSVVVPNRINDGTVLPVVQVLLDGLLVTAFQPNGTAAGRAFSSNPCWIILDILLRGGWSKAAIDLGTFARSAAYCDQTITTTDPNGNSISVPRFQCNLVLQSRRSLGDVLRGVRNSSRLYFTFGFSGQLQLNVENTIALQQATKPAGSNSTVQLNGGWPAYEFGDGTTGVSGILRNNDRSSSVRLSAKSSADCPNRYSVEFQDAFNEYQQDSFSVVDADDVAKTGQEIAATLNAFGLPNYDQAARILAFQLVKSVAGNVIVDFQTSVRAVGLFPGDIITITYLKEGFERQPFRLLKVTPGYNFRTATITAQIHDDSWYSDSGQSNASGRRLSGAGIGLPRPIAGTIVDENGQLQFDVSEAPTELSDGTTALTASVAFAAPNSVSNYAPGIPLLSLSPTESTVGGTLVGGQTLYYAVSAVDSAGNEGALSFVVRAVVSAGVNTNTVTLGDLSLPPTATGFHVYRGPNPSQLFRIATDAPPSATFVDTGLPPQAFLPPDSNFDHTNFYFRLELQPEAAVTTYSATTAGNGSLEMLANQYRGSVIRITRGLGASQERTIIANDLTTITVSSAWDLIPDSSSYFVIAQSSFQFGASSTSSPAQFAVPNRPGATIQISGRSANSIDGECPYAISPLTRWQIGGVGNLNEDVAVPAQPQFGLSLSDSQGGTVELDQIAFADLTNTKSITAGTYTFHFYDELSGPPTQSLTASIGAEDTSFTLSAAMTVSPNDFVQLGSEVVQVVGVDSNQTGLQVARGRFGIPAGAQASGTLAYLLQTRVLIVPFIRNFFGSPASGDWTYSVAIPNARIAAAELMVTNSQGNSPVGTSSFTNNIDQGIRTLSGGQYSFQVAGFLAVQTAAAPDISVEGPHAIRDVFAVVKTAPAGAAVTVRLNLNGALLCNLTIPDGSLYANPVRGLLLPTLKAGDLLSLAITTVGVTVPSSDLTVVMRL